VDGRCLSGQLSGQDGQQGVKAAVDSIALRSARLLIPSLA
jgi:hypothetical protein